MCDQVKWCALGISKQWITQDIEVVRLNGCKDKGTKGVLRGRIYGEVCNCTLVGCVGSVNLGIGCIDGMIGRLSWMHGLVEWCFGQVKVIGRRHH